MSRNVTGHATAIEQLPARWRASAEELKRYGADAQARALEEAAEQLEAAIVDRDDAELTLQEAATESGYSAKHLGRLLAEGQLANRGKVHAPRIRRGDLPRKVTPLRPPPATRTVRAQIARSVVAHQSSEARQ